MDIGNTRIRWCRSEGGLASDTTVIEYDKAALHGPLGEAWTALPRPARVVVSNVAGADVRATVEAQSSALWGVAPVFIAARSKAGGVTNGYARPERLGSDRWAAMIAARRRVNGAVCVIDCGTAMTVDVLDTQGHHQGGLILPGLTMLRRSLTSGTSGLRLDEAETPRRPRDKVTLLAADTSDAIEAGTLYMMIAAIDRICRDVEADLGVGIVRVITGGDAPVVLPLLTGEHIHEPDLVLQGLALLAGDLG